MKTAVWEIGLTILALAVALFVVVSLLGGFVYFLKLMR